jgi:hypothetical protein
LRLNCHPLGGRIPMSKPSGPNLTPDDERRIAGLCPDIAALLNAELRSGNFVVETWEGFGVYVLLGKRFQLPHSVEGGTVEYRDVDDPHYWKAEYCSQATGQCLGGQEIQSHSERFSSFS